jgi:hypothetical protein
VAKKSVPNSASLRCEAIAILATQLEILATLRDPKTAASNKPGTFIRQAARLIESVPQHLTPRFEELSTEEMRRDFLERLATIEAEDNAWKLEQAPHITFHEAIQKEWCRHKSLRGLTSILERVRYPERCFWSGGRINQPAYKVVLQRDHERRKRVNAEQKREKRKPKSPSKPLQ